MSKLLVKDILDGLSDLDPKTPVNFKGLLSEDTELEPDELDNTLVFKGSQLWGLSNKLFKDSHKSILTPIIVQTFYLVDIVSSLDSELSERGLKELSEPLISLKHHFEDILEMIDVDPEGLQNEHHLRFKNSIESLNDSGLKERYTVLCSNLKELLSNT